MRLSFLSSYCSNFQSLGFLPAIRPRWARLESTTHLYRQKEKIVVIMGATGTGKSRLSINLATRFPSEIINSDKMQVYKGLNITTNKILMHDRLGVPHHLLGEFDSSEGELPPAKFRSLASSTISDILTRRRLPLVVGGSNSFIHALLTARFDSDSDVFDGLHSVSSELRYNCRFLWVDVSLSVLYEYLSRRVDDMLNSGMLDELTEFYSPGAGSESVARQVGLRKAIGVPEFAPYFLNYELGSGIHGGGSRDRLKLFEEAVDAIKENTCQLAKRQIGKILRLRSAGWNLRRLDATEAFRAVLASDPGRSSEFWKKDVMEPSVKMVKRFLEE